MLNYVWLGLLIAGFTVGILNGRIEAVTQAAVNSAGSAVELCIGLAGVICLWTGMMEIAKKSGLIKIISRLVKPGLRLLFPDIPPEHPAAGAMVMNLAANFLGLGNAATPLGLKAMSELHRLNLRKDTASDAMCTFLVLNTSAIQLIPATVIAIRSRLGSHNPTEIIGPVWLASSFAMITGIIAVKIFSAVGRTGRHKR